MEQRIAPDLPLVNADESALQRCLENLLANAVKYAGGGGWIGIRAAQDGTEVLLTVADRGPGINPRERSRLFEPFFRGAAAREAQLPGTGLGLNLVRQMMEAMGGRVSVESRPGKGCAFTLHLRPAAAAALQPEDQVRS